MLWVFISLSNEYFYTMHFPVEFTDLPEGYAISNISEEVVNISLKGIGWQLAQITFGRNPKFSIPVQGEPGRQTISLRNAIDYNTWLSTAVEINDYSPSSLQFNLEKVKTKTVPVRLNIDTEFSEGYGLVSQVEFEPDSVTVSGPESIVNSIDSVTTINKVYEDVNHRILQDIELEKIEMVEYNRNRVRVILDVQKIVDKEFEGVEIEVLNIPPSKDLTLIPSKVSIILRGGINMLGKLTPGELSAHVKFSEALKDTLGYIVPTVEVPEFMELIDIKPRRIEYIIQQY